MATLVIYADAADGFVQSVHATYLTMRAGPAVGAANGLYIGQYTGYNGYESFVSFDSTGGLVAGDTVTAVVASFTDANDSSHPTDFTVEARTHNWGASVTAGDWIAGADLGGKTLQASLTTVGWSGGQQKDLTSEAGFPAAVVKNGVTYLVLCSSRLRNGDVPAGDEFISLAPSETAGTISDPKLTITYTAGGSPRSQAVVIA
jgi:hypothetical protein